MSRIDEYLHKIGVNPDAVAVFHFPEADGAEGKQCVLLVLYAPCKPELLAGAVLLDKTLHYLGNSKEAVQIARKCFPFAEGASHDEP